MAIPSLVQPPSRALPQIDQYQLVRSIGAGGMGVVYEAVHLRLRRRVALKILSPHALASTDAVDRFEREIAAIGQLSHPNIVQALDAGVDGTTHFLVMEYVDGSNVESICRQSGPLRLEDACEVVRQAALGLTHVHTFGIVHRDLKPSNLLLSKSGQVKIADLGLARFFVPVDDESLTNVGDILGTYDYMSPEQAAGGKVGPEADVYSLGATLYRLLAGTPVFPNSRYPSPSEKLRAHMQELPPKLSAARDGIPPQLDALLQQLLHKDASARPASLDKVVDVLGQFTKQADLSALIASDSTPARAFDLSTQVMASGPTKPKRPLRLTTWSRRRASLTAGFAVTIIAFAAWWFAGRSGVGGSNTPLPIISPPAAGAPSPPEDVISNTLELRRWYPLLNRAPTEIIWPHDAISSVHFDSERKSLHLSCAVLGVVDIGRVEISSYRLRLEVHQNQWQGHAGLAFGLRPHSDIPGGWIAQGLIFESPPSPGLEPQMHLLRTKLVFTPLPDGDFREQLVDERAAPIPFPDAPIQSLEVEIVHGKLSRIRWGDSDVSSLCADDINQLFLPEDFNGQIGIVVSECDLTLSEVEVMPLYR